MKKATYKHVIEFIKDELKDTAHRPESVLIGIETHNGKEHLIIYDEDDLSSIKEYGDGIPDMIDENINYNEPYEPEERFYNES